MNLSRQDAASRATRAPARATAAPDAAVAVTFGSAHLMVQRMPRQTAQAATALLDAAVRAGATRLDTAPLYGHGACEALVAAVAAAHPGLPVTTKVGLDPSPAPPAWRWAAGQVLRRVPVLAGAARQLRARLRPGLDAGVDVQAEGPSGRFDSAAVRRSIEQSLHHLGHIDRLLLHEVHPADIDDTLLELLTAYQRRGDVRALGVATGNAVTAQALQRGHGVFSVAHVSADALLPPVLPGLRAVAFATHGVGPRVHVVGHGVLGAGGRTLACLRQRLRDDPAFAARWRVAVQGTRFAAGLDGQARGFGVRPDPDLDRRVAVDSGRGAPAENNGLVRALCARAAAQGFGELLVVTSRLSRVAATVQAAASADQRLPPAAAALLDAVFDGMAPGRTVDGATAATPVNATASMPVQQQPGGSAS